MKDLLLLVPDRNMEAVFRELLARNHSLGIRPIGFDVHVHPQRDPGCYNEGAEWLRAQQHAYEYLLVCLDFAWEGHAQGTAADLRASLRDRLERCGLGSRSDALVIVPELEQWLFVDSPHVANGLGYDSFRDIRQCLQDAGLWPAAASKPEDPKRATEFLLQRKEIPRSSSIYRRIARKVSLTGCRDPAFDRLRQRLRGWFPPEGSEAGTAST